MKSAHKKECQVKELLFKPFSTIMAVIHWDCVRTASRIMILNESNKNLTHCGSCDRFHYG